MPKGGRCASRPRVKDFDPTNFIAPKDVKKMDQFVHYALAAAEEALGDAGLTIDESNRNEIGVYIGSGIGGLPVIEQQYEKMAGSGQPVEEVFAFLHSIPDRQHGVGAGID